VPEAVAVRSVRAGMSAGYVTGAATGVGLGAALAYLVSAGVRGRKKVSITAAFTPCARCRYLRRFRSASRVIEVARWTRRVSVRW
jgi:hypothetical protein